MKSATVLIPVLLVALPALSRENNAALADPQLAAAADALTARAQVAAPGAERLGNIVAGRLVHREATTVRQILEPNRCYKVLAQAGSGATDLVLSLTAKGDLLAEDRVSGATPIVQWCAPARTEVEVKLLMVAGEGPYAIAFFALPMGATRAVTRVGGDETDFLANRLRQLHAQFGKGRAAISPVHRGNVGPAGEQFYELRLAAGHCYTIIAAGAPSVRQLDLVLYDPSGRELQQDATSNNMPVLETRPCLTFAGTYKVKARVFSGTGQFALQAFSD